MFIKGIELTYICEKTKKKQIRKKFFENQGKIFSFKRKKKFH